MLTDEGQLVRPDAADQELLLRIHTPEYLRSLRNSGTIMRILEVPMISMLPASTIDKHVLLPMRYATGGSLQAALLAYRHGWGINLAGGYHHCSAAQGGGFCAYADISLCILGLKDCHPGIRRIMIYDGDAHQGNGFGADKRNGVYERAGVSDRRGRFCCFDILYCSCRFGNFSSIPPADHHRLKCSSWTCIIIRSIHEMSSRGMVFFSLSIPTSPCQKSKESTIVVDVCCVVKSRDRLRCPLGIIHRGRGVPRIASEALHGVRGCLPT